ncbi:cytochrome c3 family protein [Arenibacter sp. GZD96]|uniref:hypothetical protein n=1 Tax=Aurantibrevibacter litoralis TaxID=3106030 RepID=UPI002AFE21DA|nr:hypothetical protein [Arenibacter sp. GZD-96]MEA1787660.1 cytochrome c3 family protein [Arenibacter sp. GZD-96]
MKNNSHTYYVIFLLIAALNACKETSEYHSVTDKIEAETTPYHGKHSSESLLLDLELIEITEGQHTFFILERQGQLKSFPCTECHNKPLMTPSNHLNGQKAHRDIVLNHANSETMNCATCHNGKDMNSLNTLTHQEIDFNRSYTLCAQCHFSAFEDWKGGAHGKKIAGWAPPRASMTCVNCHDPHRPGFEKRWPVHYNTQTGKERKEGLDH